MQPPRRPRKTSVGVVGVFLRVAVVVGLVAMVGWPEWHIRIRFGAPHGAVRLPGQRDVFRDASLAVILPSGD